MNAAFTILLLENLGKAELGSFYKQGIIAHLTLVFIQSFTFLMPDSSRPIMRVLQTGVLSIGCLQCLVRL